jgi:membrane-associated protease RseP (regulator of RpoE activity)
VYVFWVGLLLSSPQVMLEPSLRWIPTFIATVFTASAATFGINTMKKGGDEEDEKKEEPRREEFVEAPPEPPVEAVEEVATSLVERVEALEGTVTPRT